MIIAFCISQSDQELAFKNAQWINELGGCKGHEVLFGYDKRCYPGTVDAIGIELSRAFDKVYPMPFEAEIDGWPQGANYFFRTAAGWIQAKPNTRYFLWMEPDAIPLEPGWMDMLEAEYQRGGKPFMGDRVQVENIPLHMSGVGIYPIPLHAHAGEAYRAFDVAWDMAGKDQIVPKAHFTKLIEHAWKHPKFTTMDELRTQIRPEAVLFHSSKDGSLIDLLRSKKGKETTRHDASTVTVPMPTQKEPEEPGSPSPSTPVCDIFIRTYPGDYQWLHWCLRSINRFARGFRKIWIVSPSPSPVPMDTLGYEWKTMNDETTDGYLAQQITKLYADVITDYQPDYILHIDSDVILNRLVTPQDFFKEGKVVWPYTPYEVIQTPWQPVTEKFMVQPVEFEFMRRFPIMVPRWLYPKLREFCHRKHAMVISDYIRSQPMRAFSEFNALGAYAYAHHHDQFYFRHTQEEGPMPAPFSRQFHSWGGITPEIQSELDKIFGKGGSGDTPEPTAGAGAAVEVSRSLPPPGVRELPSGIWVIEGDTHVSKWIESEKRLDHDQNTLPKILPLINEGDTVIDAGAFVGDHTIAYLQKVGPGGTVHAFEPNPLAMQCLNHNLASLHDDYTLGRLLPHQIALGHEPKSNVLLSGNNNNSAGAYLGDHMPIGEVSMMRLDSFGISPDFIKWDVEGCEVKALMGAQETIKRCRPIMVMEVNVTALDRQGNTVGELFALLESHGYEWQILQENCGEFDLLYDIVCRCSRASPEVSDKGNGETGSRCTSTPPPVTPLEAIAFLQEYAARGRKERQLVMYGLWRAGLNKSQQTKKKNDKIPVSPPAGKESSAADNLLRPQGPSKPRKRSSKKLVPTEETK